MGGVFRKHNVLVQVIGDNLKLKGKEELELER